MRRAERQVPLVVADFDFGDRGDAALPAGRVRVRAARRLGADWVAVEPGPGLAAAVQEARGGGTGLLVRVRETSEIPDLSAALGVPEGGRALDLRERLLVVVDNERAGRHLRRGARELPSARELVPAGHVWRVLLGRAPNFFRAASDADDLVVPCDLVSAARVGRLAAVLARRAARLFLSEVPPARERELADLPVAGLLVRHPWT